MNILVAPDSFKGSLTADEAASAMVEGILAWNNQAVVRKVPLSDGGEGFVSALVKASRGELFPAVAADPLGRTVQVQYGWIEQSQTAIIDTASASGLTLVSPEERNPLAATSYGTGQLIAEALKRGSKTIVVGLGGSAVNDGGIGMAQALGFRFYDADGSPIPVGGNGWLNVSRIDASGVDPRLYACEIVCACDVENLLCGPAGASRVFGPQKGAGPEAVELLDRGLARLAAAIERDLGKDISRLPGGGAAGGLGAGFAAFCNAKLKKGIDLILDAVQFDDMLTASDLVLTGEGCTDEQTLHGKVVSGVARRAARYGKPVVCLSGSLAGDYGQLRDAGVAAFFSVLRRPVSPAEAMAGENAYPALVAATREVMHLAALNVR
ncbi:glycerate kinase [Paenibacillus sp. 32O-W]|uniref:glycerate kinase family protein n=1 Tax=Paenibacillus sp. 32O-W TaxID=1695218 RepID=UPI000720CDE3|nr:glycerate kinase [Paenibacillus sp. 32O-W]ALS27140.1 glycerate kinase [Paenibacillus sp. 32O-W]